MKNLIDPIKFVEKFWPDVRLYNKQIEILRSVRDNDETIVPAGNMLGKDFIAGLCALWFFIAHKTVRIVTTSVKDDHLRVLWGEIKHFISTSAIPLRLEDGGILIVNHRAIYKHVHGVLCDKSYLIGTVSQKGEGMAGHHAPATLAIMDEASGIDEEVYTQCETWLKTGISRSLIIGNTNQCSNFFYRNIKEGDIKSPKGNYYRRIIKIKADDSPNVRWARAEINAGREESGEILIPGVLSYDDYRKRRKLWDKVRQCVALDAEFYEGAEILMYPPEWLNAAEQYAQEIKYNNKRNGLAIGVDPAEGGDSSAWAVVDKQGLIKLKSMKTPDTSVIPNITLALMHQYNVPAEKVAFDAGGGGKQHADKMRADGHKVQTVAFGSAATPIKRRGMTPLEIRKIQDETKYIYKNRRAEMYGRLREKLDPSNDTPFAISADWTELRRQLGPIPMKWDTEGQLMMLPKNKRDSNSNTVTLQDIIGCSPDEADALVLAVHAMETKSTQVTVSAVL